MTIAVAELQGAGGLRREGTDTRPIRLTARGQIAVLVTSLLLGLVLLTLLGGSAESTSEIERPGAAETVVVEPDQTVWDIAADVAPDHDPREVVADIVDLNALSDAGSVLPGQSLFLPAY